MLRLPIVEDRVGYKKTRIYALVIEGKFPPPTKLGARRIAWPEHIIDQFLAGKIMESALDRSDTENAKRHNTRDEPAKRSIPDKPNAEFAAEARTE
jgi:prophage regulatory protein